MSARETGKLTPKARAAVLEATPKELPDWRGLLGHGAAAQAWRTLAAKNRLPQVMLLVGRSGVGKRALLAMHAALNLCERREAAACGTCAECRAVLLGAHPEVLWAEPDPESGKILIETAADLQDFLSLEPAARRPGLPPTRVALVADCDRMSVQAANRLLKILEEPPPRVRIVMTTSRPRAVLETVRSRCVAWRLPPPPVAETTPWLVGRLRASGVDVPDEARLGGWLKRAGLAPGEALRLALEELAAGSEDGPSADAACREDLAAAIKAERSAARLDEALEACARATRGTKVGIETLLAEYEMALNAAYARGAPQRAAALSRRRDILARARQLAAFGRVALNAQLTAEAATLAGLT
jgi:hypothetical protein